MWPWPSVLDPCSLTQSSLSLSLNPRDFQDLNSKLNLIYNFLISADVYSNKYSRLLFLCRSFQIIVGILFLIIGGLNINQDGDQRVADILNDVITVTVFLITLVNVVINGFGIRHTDTNVGIK